MSDSPVYGTLLRDRLRKLIKDTSYEYPQLDIRVVSGAYASATVEVLDDSLVLTRDASTSTLSFGTYPTIELLLAPLRAIADVTVRLVGDGDPNHVTQGLQVIPPTNCLNRTVMLYSRRWSDSELDYLIDLAVQRHNLSIPIDGLTGWTGNYTSADVPTNHQQMVLTLAQIEVLKAKIQDSLKRRGTDMSSTDFTQLIGALETQYSADLARYREWLRDRVPTLEESASLDAGQIIVGTQLRETGFYQSRAASAHLTSRSGWIGRSRRVPSAAVPAPTAPVLSATQISAGVVKLTWTENRELSFDKYELWRGTSADLSNESEYAQPSGSIPATGTKIRTEVASHRPLWVDGATTALTADTYYYRVYAFNRNGRYASSNIVSVTVT